MKLVLSIITILVLSSCSTPAKVSIYNPKPTNPKFVNEDFKRLLYSAKKYKPVSIEMHNSFVNIIYLTGVGINSVSIPFAEIEKIEILEKKKNYIVRVKDKKERKLFEYFALDQEKAEEMADVLLTLSKLNGDRENTKEEQNQKPI